MNIFGFHVKRDFPNSPFFHFTGTHYFYPVKPLLVSPGQLSIIPTFQLRSEAELSSSKGLKEFYLSGFNLSFTLST